MKTIQDNDTTDLIGLVYAKNDIEHSWLIKSGVVYDENQIGQQRDQLYRCGLYRNWTELSGPIELGAVYDEIYTRQQHDQLYKYSLHRKLYQTIMTDYIGCCLWQKLDNTTTWSSYKSGLHWNRN